MNTDGYGYDPDQKKQEQQDKPGHMAALDFLRV
jgi:hypothetical protein